MAHQKGEPFCFVAFFDIAKSLSFFAKKKSLRPRRLFHSFSFQQFYVRIFELFLTSKELNFSFGDQSMLDFCRNQFHCANQVGHLKKPVVRWRNRLEFHVFKQHAKNGCEQPPHLGLPIVVINLNSVKALEIVEMVFYDSRQLLAEFQNELNIILDMFLFHAKGLIFDVCISDKRHHSHQDFLSCINGLISKFSFRSNDRPTMNAQIPIAYFRQFSFKV